MPSTSSLPGHSPGPWAFDGDWYRFPTVFSSDGAKVAFVEKVGFPKNDDRTPEQEANARLIAAAPVLLEVAKAMIPANLCITNPNVRDDVVVPMEVTMGELRKIAAAIARAEPQP